MEVLRSLRLKEQAESGEMKEPEIREVQILLSSKEDPVSMRFLGVSMSPSLGLCFSICSCWSIASNGVVFVIHFICRHNISQGWLR